MIPGPKKDNRLLVIGVLILIVIIAIGVFLSLSPKPEEEKDQWVAEGEILSPNTTAIILKHENCEGCRDSAESLLNGLQQDEEGIGTRIVDVETVYDSSGEGRALVAKYNITKLPTLILQKEGQWDSRMLSIWFSGIGTVEDDGSLVYREVIPPYYDTTTGSVSGKVKFIYITDEECEECYNVSLFAADLAVIFDMYVDDATEYDILSVEGNAIVSEYRITMIPAFLVSSEASVYDGFEDFWFTHDNTQEEDGWYVFRDVDQIGVEYVELNETD